MFFVFRDSYVLCIYMLSMCVMDIMNVLPTGKNILCTFHMSLSLVCYDTNNSIYN